MRRLILSLGLLLPASALAVPMEFTHQGRLFDDSGLPLDGAHDLTFSLYDDPATGTLLWTETMNIDLQGGFYSVQLGTTSALDSAAFDGSTLYMELAVDSGPALTDRIAVVSVPYAIRAGAADTATDLAGGVVDATEIRVNGSTIIDSDGNIDGASLPGGDGDTLADLSCSSGEVAVWDGLDWQCADKDDLHTHAADDIDTGVFDAARLPVGSGTGQVAAGDHAHAADDITSGVLTVSRLPIGTGTTQVAAGDHGHTAIDVGALPAGTTASDIGALPDTTTASDIGALPDTTTAADIGALPDTTTASDIGALPDTTTASDIGALPDTTTAADLGAVTAGGIVEVGTDGDDTCDSSRAGVMRWTGAALQFCNGAFWQNIGLVVGTSAAFPGEHCLDILDNAPGIASGVYWIDPDGAGGAAAYEAYCDMTTDGGGWTQIMYNRGSEGEGNNQAYAAVFSTTVRGTPQTTSYKWDNSWITTGANELRYTEPSGNPADPYFDSWTHDFACGLTASAKSKIDSPGNLNQAPAPVVCTNINTGAVSTNAHNLNYQRWSGGWTGPRLWIGDVATAGQYHGDYCVDCVVTWKNNNSTSGVYSGPSTAGSNQANTVAFWVR